MILGLEGMIQGHNERVIAGGQDFLLRQGTLDLISFDHLFLA